MDVDGGVPPAKLQCPAKDTKKKRLEASLRLLFVPVLTLGSEDPKYMVAGPWGAPCSPESLGCVEAGWSCWSQTTAALQVSAFRLKQGQVQLLAHLVKMMGFFGVMQVSRGTWGLKLEGASVTGVLCSGFVVCSLIHTQHNPGAFASTCTQKCSPQQWCILCFIQHVRFNLASLAGDKLFWFQHYPVTSRTPAWSFLCSFLVWCLLLRVSLTSDFLQELFPAMAEHLQL